MILTNNDPSQELSTIDPSTEIPVIEPSEELPVIEPSEEIPTTPGAPTNLVKDHSLTTTDQVSFTWSAPEDDGGSSILSYSVELLI